MSWLRFVVACVVLVLACGTGRRLCAALNADLDRVDAGPRPSGLKPPRVLPRPQARTA